MTDSELARKLGLKQGQRVVILNAPQGYVQSLGELPEGVKLSNRVTRTPSDLVHLFVRNSEELEQLAPSALRALKPDALLWISYPKKSSRVETDLSRDHDWDPLRREGYDTVSAISIDDTWSALRFRPQEKITRQRRK